MNNELEEILDDLKKNKSFSIEQLKYFVDVFDDRFWRALRNILRKSVKKYIFTPSNRVIWIVIGKTKDYMILSNLYCPCEDFYLNVVSRKTAKMCYHLLSKVLAEPLEYYEEIKVEDDRYDELMKDWKQS